MKKVALSLLALALLGVSAFADDMAAPAAPKVTIGDWGRQIFAIGNDDSSGTWYQVGTSWDSQPRLVGLNIQASYDFGGFSITPSADNRVFGLTDQNKAWITPMPGLTVETGTNLETDTWRGTSDYGIWDWLRPTIAHGDSTTFFRLGEGNGYQTDVNYNKDGIGAWVLIDQNNTNVATSQAPLVGSAIGDSVQLGGAYTIPNIGVIKAQYLGTAWNNNTAVGGVGALGVTSGIGSGKGYQEYQVAFNLSAVQNLYEEGGFLVPSSSSDAGYAFQFMNYLTYTADKAKIHLQIIATDYTGGNAAADTGFGLEGGLGADYDLGDGVGIGADLRYINQLQVLGGVKASLLPSPPDAVTNLLVDVTKTYSNGDIGIGVEYSTNEAFAFGAGTPGVQKAHWAVPVRMEEWF